MQPAIRKAAILIQALDPSSADAMLAQLEPSVAQRVREAARKLSNVSPREQQAVLEEFFARGETSPSATTPVDRIAATAIDEVVLEQQAPPPTRRPFQFLETVDVTRLAMRLRAEHPQTIAIVVAHAPRAVAAELLWRFPESLRNDVLVRVIEWQGADPQLLEELERALEVSLATMPSATTEATGLETAREILTAIADRERAELLDALARVDAAKAALLRGSMPDSTPANETPQAEFTPWSVTGADRSSAAPTEKVPPALRVVAPPEETDASPPEPPDPELTFDDFLQFDDRTLSRVFAEAEPAIALLALAGADLRLVDRLMRRLPRKEAARLQQRIEKLGSFRLRDVELAQRELARVACRLAEDGRIRLPMRRMAA